MMSTDKISTRANRVEFHGRILFLTEDISLIRRQLEATGDEAKRLEDELAQRLANNDLPLMNNISTDEITPGWVCFHYDETLGQYVYVGMRDGAVKKDEVKNGGFAVVVSGLSKGCGSSRETAPYAEKWAGIQLVIAKSIEKIYGQNSQNIGLLTSTDFGLIERIRRGEEISLSEFTKDLDPISKDIVDYGGLFNYNKARLAGKISPPPIGDESVAGVSSPRVSKGSVSAGALPDGRATDTPASPEKGISSPRVSKGSVSELALPDGRATDTPASPEKGVSSPRV